ncbi:PP2C family protein-serine/threonine phosphatase [Mangrovicoccus algicola]|uniref:SpoIIE family protein phosphatase n=1 Tax=Mangrovicoccus algicola TaxID=2771008 RepID=A0A8J6YYS3_9RHOB|nr:SpoIIE family protein phosphatase [Mangrovicoccus algicola]MBE3638243.1 SpoIIE family protein phosphatase [Mangrovicoccus algicola]
MESSLDSGTDPPPGDILAAGLSEVLIVDDSRMQRRILSATLRRMGYRVTEAGSGEEALDLCRGHAFDLVLSDWMMPGMDGPEFCARFRDLEPEGYGYFILLTSKSERDDIAKGLEVGADDFITKPVNAVELRARLTAGQRIVAMQRQLSQKNRQLSLAFQRIRTLYDAIEADLAEGKRLQQSLIRDRHRDFGQAEMSLLLRSAGHVGGDLVGWFPVAPGRIGLYAIDVSGHGITSALLTARLAGYLSSTSRDQNVALDRLADGSYRPLPPPLAVRRLNDLMFQDIETEHYFTLCLAIVDLETGEVEMTQAGHPHPAVQRADGRIEFFGAGDLPVGLLPQSEYDGFRFRLHPGDRLLMASDGVTECPAGPGRSEMIGEDGLANILSRNRGLAGPRLLEAMVWDLSQFYGAEDLPDDVSAVLLEYRGPTRAPPLA